MLQCFLIFKYKYLFLIIGYYGNNLVQKCIPLKNVYVYQLTFYILFLFKVDANICTHLQVV